MTNRGEQTSSETHQPARKSATSLLNSSASCMCRLCLPSGNTCSLSSTEEYKEMEKHESPSHMSITLVNHVDEGDFFLKICLAFVILFITLRPTKGCSTHECVFDVLRFAIFRYDTSRYNFYFQVFPFWTFRNMFACSML